MKWNIEVNGRIFTAAAEENEAAAALTELMPLTVKLSDYAGFEKVGAIGKRLPANDRRTTTNPGDIVLYSRDQIVMFYGKNTWEYTRLGQVEDLAGWKEALGSGNVTVVLTPAE